MDKLLTFAGYEPRGGPHIFPLETTSLRLIKTATALHPDVQMYINSAKPIPGKSQLLIDALGCSEFWGNNVNGDRFPSEALAHDGPEYGARTFEIYGYPFKHHLNKDPAKAYGDKVTLARYYAKNGRVQLIVAFHNDKAADIIENVENGIYPDVSMGCRVPWDECTECGNRAKTRATYCNHLKYQMNQILPGGKIIGAINRLPKFFDISVVMIGAEKASHVLSKVASASPYSVISSALAGENHYGKIAASAKAAAQTKDADIDKNVPSNIPPDERVHIDREEVGKLMDGMGEAKGKEQTLPPSSLDEIAKHPVEDIFSTLSALGIPLKPHEFQRIMLIKLGHRDLADQLWNDNVCFDEASGSTTTKTAFTFDPNRVSEKIANIIGPAFIGERSCYPEILEGRVSLFEKRGEDWYGTTEREKKLDSNYTKMIPLMLTLAGAYKVLKNRLPQVEVSKLDAALERNPWLLPLLFSVGVGSTVAANGLLTPIEMKKTGQVDAHGRSMYSGLRKHAVSPAWLQLGSIPATYMYSGVQRHRAMQGENLNWLDQAVAERPELAATLAFFAAPKVGKGIQAAGRVVGKAKTLLKGASIATDVGSYALASGTKLMPAALAGAAIDAGILRGIENILRKREANASNTR